MVRCRLSASVSPLLALDIAIAAQNGSNGNNGIRTRDYVPNAAAQGALDHLVNWANEQQKQKTLCTPLCERLGAFSMWADFDRLP